MIYGSCCDWWMEDIQNIILNRTLKRQKWIIDAYPYYRQRNNGKSFERSGGYVVNNHYVSIVLFYQLFVIVT